MIAALLLVMLQQNPDTMPPIITSVTRAPRAIWSTPASVEVVHAADVLQGKPANGLDELLANVPGVYATNRWNYSLDQRLAIRGFGARSSFGIRGVKVLLDGIPQTLPDGSGQLTNVDFELAEAVEVMRGPASSLFGNASGGVIGIETQRVFHAPSQEVRVAGGPLFVKWQGTTRLPLGSGGLTLSASRLNFDGERQHSRADSRNYSARFVTNNPRMPVALALSYGDDPRADNPGALTAAELTANRDSAAAINLARKAGKDVAQFQAGASLRRSFESGDVSLAVFGISRALRNPQTFAYIDLDRTAWGARVTGRRFLRLGVPGALTLGADFQRQRDDRLNRGNSNGSPDTVRQLDQLERVTEIGPFVQLVLEMAPATAVTLGTRYDRVSFAATDRLVTASNPDDSGRRAMSAPSFSAGITHRHGYTTFFANAGTSFETPTTTELGNRPDTAGGFNATLQPQKAFSVEAGVRGIAGRDRYALSVYRASVRDALIASQVPSSPGRVFYQNAGRSRHQGIEASAQLALGGWGSIGGAYTWSDFRYTSYTTRGHVLDGRRLPGIPEHWAHVTLDLRPAFARGAWITLDQSLSSSVLVDDTLEVRNSGWQTLDVRLGWNGRVGSVSIAPFAAVNNVFDRAYVPSVVINAANGRYFEPAPGRNAYVGMSISLGGR